MPNNLDFCLRWCGIVVKMPTMKSTIFVEILFYLKRRKMLMIVKKNLGTNKKLGEAVS